MYRNMENTISIDEFKKVEIRVGEILSAEPVEGSEKLLRLRVNFGPASAPAVAEALADKEAMAGEGEIRQVVSGISKFFPDRTLLVGKRCAFATNLEVRKIMGLESQAMILATGGEPLPDAPGEFGPLYLFECGAPVGSQAH